jgi:ubiquitin-like-conjugating enzyme ATG3
MRTRTFDLSITYDKYYQTPRVWVSGYSASGTPLPPSSLFDSISTEHARKTVTIETHPAFGIPMASIHPCKHAHVMKRIVRFMSEEKGQSTAPGCAVVRVDQYLVVFLKFISTVLPHIDYDHTMSLDA